MNEINSVEHEAPKLLKKILARAAQALARSIKHDPAGWRQFMKRLHKNFPALFRLYAAVYSGRYDFYFHLEDLVISIARLWFERPPALRRLDRQREKDPLWFQSNQMLAGVCYVDRFAKNLKGIKRSIPYFKELGLTYLHLMPLFKSPENENDGGYAVSSYRQVARALGSMKELATLAAELRKAGISLALDLVFNHTSDEHIWAQRAKRGEEEYMDFYRIFPDRELPDRYEQNLREIFPEEHPGAFSPLARFGKPPKGYENGWVWTTFHSYQWDLNYANPAVFNRMAEEMLFLANQGVEVIRLDAVAFIWKQLGTSCENLPQAHMLIQAFNAVARIAAPALIFKSEAIVHPDDVVKYISPEECQISYNPLFMALLWNSLATRKTRLLSQALAHRFNLPAGTAWVNYVRVHDDIGWTFSDEDAALLGVNGNDHRRFLNEFYRGRFKGSFARGLPFQENPVTGDCRISGTCASLAGLEKALEEQNEEGIELAIRRILLIHGVILLAGGIPLLYLGDEIGTLNDYTFRNDPARERDSRWVHRPRADWKKYGRRSQPGTVEYRIYQGLRKLIQLRKKYEAFGAGRFEVIDTGSDHLLGFQRISPQENIIILANFSERPQIIPLSPVLKNKNKIHGLGDYASGAQLTLEPLDLIVLHS